jgi:toxin ParE1/3/4
MRCVFSPAAERDLEEIGDYIARDNPRRAVSFIAEMEERCLLIVQTPHGLPLREDLATGIRMAIFGRYLIFYTVHEDADELRVERILHSARDIDQSFFTNR